MEKNNILEGAWVLYNGKLLQVERIFEKKDQVSLFNNGEFYAIVDIAQVEPYEKPILDNRIVSDKTFAVRLRNFVNSVEVNDMAGEEEKEYLLNVAHRLIAYQKLTMMTKEERDYFKMVENE